jgi:type IV pilus biogenesis protein CpaD/CtpE
MRSTRLGATVLLAAAVVLTGCGRQAQQAREARPDAATTVAPSGPVRHAEPQRPAPDQPAPATPRRLHFATPQASMRYLAAAYNRNHFEDLKHVTTPTARANLLAMRAQAVNLQLVGCTANAGRGDYTCRFSHDYPAAMHKPGKGQPAVFTVAPADRVGWYMTVLDGCG